MPWEIFAQYGFGGLVAGVLLWILARILKSFMSGLKEDRDNYMKIIENQATTQHNHISHLDNTVQEQSKTIAMQGEKFSNGVDKICGAVETQTSVLKSWIGKE